MTRPRRRQVVAGGVGGLAAGLALATVVLPQLANTLKPTALGIAVLTLCLGLVTSIWPIRRAYADRVTEFEAALEIPPTLVKDAVFEGVPDDPAIADPAIVGALLGARASVIVRGSREAGTSAVALASLRIAHPSLLALVPFDADGLTTIQDYGLDPGNRPGGEGVCIWLENLDRFLDTADPRALARPARRRRLVRLFSADTETEIRIVSTIESARWTELESGTDQLAQALRRLERVSTVVFVSASGSGQDATPALTPPEVAKAGHIIAAGSAPVAPEPQGDANHAGPRHSWWRDRVLLVCLMITGLAILAPFVLYVADKTNMVEAPPLTDQMADVMSSMQRDLDHGHVVFEERVAMHTTEQDSWIVAVQHGDGSKGDPTVRARKSSIGCTLSKDAHAPSHVYRSDELRIYDVHDGWLEKKLDFQPSLVGSQAATLQVADGLYENGPLPQFIAGYSVGGCLTPVLVPFAVQWDNQLNPPKYDLKGLTQFSHVEGKKETPVPGPAFSTEGLDPDKTSFLNGTYMAAVSLKNAAHADQSRTDAITAYPVSAIAVTLRPSGRLLLGYDVAAYNFMRTNTFELGVGQLRSGGIAAYPCMTSDQTCTGPATPEEIRVPPDRAPNHALLTVWPLLEHHWARPICVRSAGPTQIDQTKEPGPVSNARNDASDKRPVGKALPSRGSCITP